MSTVRAPADLLKVVERMNADEFDRFIEAALSVRRPKGATLSAAETRLIKRINRGLPEELGRRHVELRRKLRRGTLTAGEHRELLRLTHEAESRDAERAAALLELARLRRVPIRSVMKDMGIKAVPVHG